MRRAAFAFVIAFFYSCVMHSVHIPYTAKPPGKGGFYVGAGIGIERDVSNGFPSSETIHYQPEALNWRDYSAVGAMLFGGAGISKNIALHGNLSLSLPPASFEVSFGASWSFSSFPIYILTGIQPVFARGNRTDINLFGPPAYDIDYYIYGVKVPLLFTFSPSPFFEMTVGTPVQINYLDAHITRNVERWREKKFDFPFEVLISLKVKIWYIQLLPEMSFVNMEDFVSGRRIWGFYPALMLGAEVPGR